MLKKEELVKLQEFAKEIRIKTIHQMKIRGFGHIGGAKEPESARTRLADLL